MLLVVPFFFIAQSAYSAAPREPAVIQKEFDAEDIIKWYNANNPFISSYAMQEAKKILGQ
mgnify:CR=1 FL=1